MKRIVIVASSQSYRTGDFLEAAELLRLDWILASDVPPPITGGRQIEVDFSDTTGAARAIADLNPLPDAVISVDDQGVEVAAEASRMAGLPHNSALAVAATRDKGRMRDLLARADVPGPDYRLVKDGEAAGAAAELGFPVVLKPVNLSASRGVIKATNETEARTAEARIRSILYNSTLDTSAPLLVESYIGGDEIAIEGVVENGLVDVLAVIDKPEQLEGPFFEETILVTPSRHDVEDIAASVDLVQQAISALQLETGPVHAEVRISSNGPRLIEIAARTIGGLCGRALTFGLLGESLEALVLKAALGIRTTDPKPTRPASGILMLPIPASGLLSGVEGIDATMQLEGVDAIEITIANGHRVTALPEGDRYLGFVFASGMDPDQVETTLRKAAQEIEVTIDGESMTPAVDRLA